MTAVRLLGAILCLALPGCSSCGTRDARPRTDVDAPATDGANDAGGAPRATSPTAASADADSPAASSDRASPSTRPTADAHAALGGATSDLHYARVREDDGRLNVVLTAAPFGCDGGVSPPVPYASFTVPRGPGGSFYIGHPVGIEGFLDVAADRDLLVPPHLGEATLGVMGAGAARGTFRFAQGADHAEGTFDAVPCPASDAGPDESERALPSTVPAAPLSVVYEGTTIHLVSAVARVDGTGDDLHLEGLVFRFATPHEVTTLGGRPLDRDVVLEMNVSFAGASGRKQAALLATPQPITVTLGGKGSWAGYKGRGFPRPAWSGEGTGWIRLRRTSFAAGGTLTGDVAIATGAFGAAGGGTFTATIE